MRFVPNQRMTDGQLPEKNACGSAGFNCVVMADGRIQPLLLDGGSPEVRIMSHRIEGASLFIPLDTNTHLILELNPVCARFSFADEGLRHFPALTGIASVAPLHFDAL